MDYAELLTLLTETGELLYGPRWQTSLGRALGHSDGRRVRQWLSADRPLPESLPKDLENLLAERDIEIQSLLKTYQLSPEGS